MSPRSPGPNATEISRFGRYGIRPGRGRERRKCCWLAPVRPRTTRISRIRSSGPGHPLATPTIPPAGLSRGGVTTKARSSRRKRIGCDGGFGGANFDEEWGHTRDWGRLKVCRGRGFLAKTQRREVWLARVGLPVNHANVANPPCDKAIPPPRLHISVALLSAFNFLPTNPG